MGLYRAEAGYLLPLAAVVFIPVGLAEAIPIEIDVNEVGVVEGIALFAAFLADLAIVFVGVVFFSGTGIGLLPGPTDRFSGVVLPGRASRRDRASGREVGDAAQPRARSRPLLDRRLDRAPRLGPRDGRRRGAQRPGGVGAGCRGARGLVATTTALTLTSPVYGLTTADLAVELARS
jgi:hypothetical protein